MTRDDLLQFARDAGAGYIDPPCGDFLTFDVDSDQLERFAALVIKEAQKVSTPQQPAQKTHENVHVIDGADWPEPDSGFAKLEGM